MKPLLASSQSSASLNGAMSRRGTSRLRIPPFAHCGRTCRTDIGVLPRSWPTSKVAFDGYEPRNLPAILLNRAGRRPYGALTCMAGGLT